MLTVKLEIYSNLAGEFSQFITVEFEAFKLNNEFVKSNLHPINFRIFHVQNSLNQYSFILQS
jgi:hypothetical protein